MINRRDVVIAGYRGDIGTIRSGLESLDPAIRAAALGALGRAGQTTDEHYAAAVGDPEIVVRRRVAELIAAEPPATHVDQMILRLLDDESDEVVDRACFAAGEARTNDRRIVDRLIVISARHDDSLCRESAVAALGAIGDPAGLQAVLAATTDIATVRRRAAIALAAFHGDEVTAALDQLLSDRDLQVRQIAEDQLGTAQES